MLWISEVLTHTPQTEPRGRREEDSISCSNSFHSTYVSCSAALSFLQCLVSRLLTSTAANCRIWGGRASMEVNMEKAYNWRPTVKGPRNEPPGRAQGKGHTGSTQIAPGKQTAYFRSRIKQTHTLLRRTKVSMGDRGGRDNFFSQCLSPSTSQLRCPAATYLGVLRV